MLFDSLHFAPWWYDAGSLRRVIVDLLAGEMASMRPGSRHLPLPWPDTLDLKSDLGADSLDLMGLATAMETVLHLGQAPSRDGEPGAALLAHTRLTDWLQVARSGLEAGGAALTFRTSGSSGAPKPCTHALAWLEQEAAVLASLFTGRRRIVSLVASHHIYGFLFTVLLPRALGLHEGDVADLRALAPGQLAAALRPGDLVIGYPDFWRAFGARGDAESALDVVGVSSTAPCPDEVARAVLSAGLARLVQVYGSSETAGVGWRDAADSDYRLFAYWRRAAQANQLERTVPGGAQHAVALPDRLAWTDGDRFRPVGRVDLAVQVGGVNVFPTYVADVLKLHPDVLEVSVRPMRADEGQRLKAFVVPRHATGQDAAAAAPALRAALQAWCAQRLAAPECPAVFSIGPALPRGASGKLADWIIDAWL